MSRILISKEQETEIIIVIKSERTKKKSLVRDERLKICTASLIAFPFIVLIINILYRKIPLTRMYKKIFLF